MPPQVVKSASGDKVSGDDSARVEASQSLSCSSALTHLSSEEIGTCSGKGP